MTKFKLILWFFVLLQQEWIYVLCTNTRPSVGQASVQDTIPGKNLLAILGKSRQSRCVRCYENRYYDDRGRAPSTGYGRLTDDRASSNWYYPGNDRAEDRYRDYDRYDRYTPRGYNRNDARDYDRGYDRGYDYRGYDRYDDRRGSYYDRNDARGNPDLGYYGASQRGTEGYYDRNAARPVDYGYDRDYYDRYNTRYDLRNYRPLDETYRGQSGFDNTGRGYYFATQDDRSYLPKNDRRYLPENYPREYFEEDRPYLPENDQRYASQDDRRYLPQDDRRSSPCGSRVANCPYDGSSRPGMGHVSQVSSGPINSNSASPNNKGSNIVNKDDDNNNSDPKGSNMRGNENQDRDRQQSSAYGGRPPRPLGGSYLYDRENNAIVKDDYNEEPTNAAKNEASDDIKNNNTK